MEGRDVRGWRLSGRVALVGLGVGVVTFVGMAVVSLPVVFLNGQKFDCYTKESKLLVMNISATPL